MARTEWTRVAVKASREKWFTVIRIAIETYIPLLRNPLNLHFPIFLVFTCARIFLHISKLFFLFLFFELPWKFPFDLSDFPNNNDDDDDDARVGGMFSTTKAFFSEAYVAKSFVLIYYIEIGATTLAFFIEDSQWIHQWSRQSHMATMNGRNAEVNLIRFRLLFVLNPSSPSKLVRSAADDDVNSHYEFQWISRSPPMNFRRLCRESKNRKVPPTVTTTATTTTKLHESDGFDLMT